MKRIAKFEKVSFDRFYEDLRNMYYQDYDIDKAKELYENIKLPVRATSGSAGYDMRSTIGVILNPGESIKIPTGLRCRIKDGWVLKCYPRSGLGFKYRLQLDNTVGIIDSDYYNSDNEGHIIIKITNDSKRFKTFVMNECDRVCQGIFVEYGITCDDESVSTRNGGFGSTDKLDRMGADEYINSH